MSGNIRLVACSGGKDSTATLLVALERHPKEEVQAIFADTGNEHELTYSYLYDYLPQKLGITIKTVRADFREAILTKRLKIERLANGESETSVYGKRIFKHPWTKETAQEALAVFRPTGNPFLDVCLLHGGFPSSVRQFCTRELKVIPMTEYAEELLSKGHTVESWQGVRADESRRRANLPEREPRGERYSFYRPILKWSVKQVFEKIRTAGLEPNQLYKMGMGRVGCMPCIHVAKPELLEISKRFPDHIARIAKWETLVQQTLRPGTLATFLESKSYAKDAGIAPIWQRVEWAQSSRGGKQRKFDFDDTTPSCKSEYGLCE